MKYKASRDLPQFALEHKTISPSKLAEVILNRRNEKRTPESITMWFKKHREVYDALVKELVEGLPNSKEQVDSSVFMNGNFEEIPSIKEWLLEMKSRDLSHHYIRQQLGVLRQACQGSFPNCNIDLVHEGKWCLKHPDRLVLQDAMEIMALLKDKGEDTYAMKRALKDFLTSKGIVIGKKIAVGKPKSYGKLAKLFVDRTILDDVLERVESQNFEAYVADDFMFKTGTRLTATLNALADNINFEQHTIRVYDKARRSLYPEGKEWEKYIPQKLWQNIMTLLGGHRTGKVFQNIKNHDLEKLNREALKQFIPRLEPKIRMPNHFWRHMFFQHLLRATDWNYAVCAELGGSTIASLQESYGKAPEAVVREWGLKYMPSLETSEQALEQPSLIIAETRKRRRQ
jgi:integrase